MPLASMNSAQWVKTLGTSCSWLNKCSDKSHPKTRSLRIPDFFNFPRAGLDKMKLRKKLINLPCLRNTGLVGWFSEVGEPWPSSPSSEDTESLRGDDIGSGAGPLLVKWWVLAPMGKFNPCGTLSPMTSTYSHGKNPTSKPRLPRHQMDSSGGGISITEIMSPTCNVKNQEFKDHMQKKNILYVVVYTL